MLVSCLDLIRLAINAFAGFQGDSWLATDDEGSHRSFISKKPTNLHKSADMVRTDEALMR